ncbi:hypothetical protein GJ744_000885 [Endocarpon pusillum]|uniref:C2H2-type domain-containing protein n=1 Tax=Endocarpon pusillum TaxID=364733 RepID=A0A8H7AQT5_9EURO|nr:hypothetical protein GJ744_000885 [Endocarpon pusillum]
MAKRARQAKTARQATGAGTDLHPGVGVRLGFAQPPSAPPPPPHIAQPPSTFRPFKCDFSGCFRAYTRKGDLTRHSLNHATTFRVVCIIDDCPRSHGAHGFPRRDKLIDHLIQGHKMSRNLAGFALRATSRGGDWKQALKNMPDDLPSQSFSAKEAYFYQYRFDLCYWVTYDLCSLQQDLTEWEDHQA